MSRDARYFRILRPVWKTDGRGLAIRTFVDFGMIRLHLVPKTSGNVQQEQGIAVTDTYVANIPNPHALDKGWRIQNVETDKTFEAVSILTYATHQVATLNEVNDV